MELINVGVYSPQTVQSVDGVAWAGVFEFDCGDLEPRVRLDRRLHHGHTMRCRRYRSPRLQIWVSRRYEHDAVKPQFVCRRLRKNQVAQMDGVERAAEDTDGHVTPTPTRTPRL